MLCYMLCYVNTLISCGNNKSEREGQHVDTQSSTRSQPSKIHT